MLIERFLKGKVKTNTTESHRNSERQFIQQIKQWKKKVVFVLSKIDFLEQEAQLHELTEFVGLLHTF